MSGGNEASSMTLIADAKRSLAASGVDLTIVPQRVLDDIRDEFTEIPSIYLGFLADVGAGSIGGQLQLYEGPVPPEDVYDPDTAAGLEGVLLFGDDLQGYCFGFVPGDDWRVVEIDPTNGVATLLSESFESFMSAQLAKFSGR